jgi:trehalose 6-phosphate synthase
VPGDNGSRRSPVLVASNRGPVAFGMAEGGGLAAARGSGGLVSGLLGVAEDSGLTWVCAALSDADRRAARSSPGGRLDRAGFDGFDTGSAAVRMLDVDRVVFDRAYNAIANKTLWFVSHLLYAPAAEPSFGPEFRREWAAYEQYNDMFAAALADEAAPGACVLVQDYHLDLAPAQLRARRPDVRIAHFSHTPWAPPEYFRLLPDDIARQVLSGMLGADRIGFLSPRWAEAFLACCVSVLGARVHGDEVSFAGRTSRVAVHPLGVDGGLLRRRAAAPDVTVRTAELREIVGGRRLIVRIDRTELSKNIVRGMEAYRQLLRARPEWRGRVVHLVCAYPSRHDLPEYREYTAAVQRMAAEIENEFATADWDPLRLEVSDDYPRSLAALRLADVLVVNPIRDGMNLVAKEGPVVSGDGVALVLSREAGACAEMSSDAFVVNPFDIDATSGAMHEALLLDPAERRARSQRLARAATALPPHAWFRRQLDDLHTGP